MVAILNASYTDFRLRLELFGGIDGLSVEDFNKWWPAKCANCGGVKEDLTWGPDLGFSCLQCGASDSDE
jgi:hypothetical protein